MSHVVYLILASSCRQCILKLYTLCLVSCVDIQEHQAADIEIYHCPGCQKHYGPLVRKRTSQQCYIVFVHYEDSVVTAVAMYVGFCNCAYIFTVKNRRSRHRHSYSELEDSYSTVIVLFSFLNKS